jgi:RND family efflux transporter MFP subunit
MVTIGQAASSDNYEATGTIRSTLNATLSSKVLGRVISIAVHEGDSIKKGQLLVSLDPRELEAAVNMASANLHSSAVGVANASTASEMEGRTSKARVVQAEAQVSQAQAGLAAAEAKRDLAVAGPRSQEVAQSHFAVVQAESSLRLAKRELERTAKLVQDGALAKRELDLAQNRYDVSKGQYDMALESESIAREGSRSQEIRAAEDAVTQAKAAVAQAKSGVVQAKAAEMQSLMRRKEIEVAKAQVEQSSATLQSAQVALSYAQVLAPFDGRVVRRLVDPGSMASPGMPLLVVEGGGFRLEATIPERVLKSVSVGSVEPVKIDSIRAERLTGTVQEIAPQADTTSHAFVVKLALPTSNGLKSGMFGRVAIRTGSVNRTLVPASAIYERVGLNYVFAVNKEGIARLRIVTLGESIEDKVEVLSGLGTGDRIVVGDHSEVTDGVKVEAY